ncbi:hypothetical protein [Aeromicrobium endophyticum]|uniref:hypothetical protein n=1 Tax=Aeromicrobium endophyticum TaxID=2292704 RepID=UPI0011C3830A|nr:hypothetical protein [Aeromicrobium endophyticum]
MRSAPCADLGEKGTRTIPARIDQLLVAAIVDDPTVQIVYTTAVTPDSYSRAIEDGRIVFYVHPMHQAVVESIVSGQKR